MERKGTLNTVVGIVVLMLLLVVLLVNYFGVGDGLFAKVVQGTENLANKYIAGLPNKEPSESAELTIPEPVAKHFSSLASVLGQEKTGPCRMTFTASTGEFEDFKIVVSVVEEDSFIRLYSPLNNLLEQKTIPGTKPCVVAGGNIPQQFYENYLGGTPCRDSCPQDYSNSDVVFTAGDELVVGGDDYKYAPFVYKTKEKETCFIPFDPDWDPFDNCEADPAGINDDCIQQLTAGLQTCT